MIIKVGDKVRLLHTKKMGYVLDYISDQMLRVDIDGDAVPVFLDDLEFVSADVEIPQRRVAVSKEIKNISYYDSENRGTYLAFMPQRDKQENISGFHIYFINNSDHYLLLDYNFRLQGRDIYRCKKEAVPAHIYPLNKIEFDRLNESPVVEMKFWLRKKVQGKQQQFPKIIKVKPQTFFKTFRQAPLMDEMEGFVYDVFTVLPDITEPKATVAHEQVQELKKWKGIKEKEAVHQVMMKAEAPHEIDLHIEKLVKDHSKMSNREILRVQLDRCQKFLEQAIISGLHRVYLIHGLGKGKLRTEVYELLRDYPHVRSFNNNYHPKYGYGATEVEIDDN